VLTAAFWNANVRDNSNEVAPFFAAWTDFTPTFVQGVTVTYTKRRTRYLQIGKLVIAQISVDFTSAGTGGAVLAMSLPATVVSVDDWNLVGSFFFYDANVPARYVGNLLLFDSSTAFLQHGGTTANGALGTNPAITIANGDQFSCNLLYEAT
jgi:hypothetical protein